MGDGFHSPVPWHHDELGAPAQNCVHWFRALRLLLYLGFLWERSLFPNSHSGLEGADSETQEQLTSAFSHSPSHPFPCRLSAKGRVVVVCLQLGAQAGSQGQAWWGHLREAPSTSLWPVYQRVRVFVSLLCSIPREDGGGNAREYGFVVSFGIKVGSEANQIKVWTQLLLGHIVLGVPCAQVVFPSGF